MRMCNGCVCASLLGEGCRRFALGKEREREREGNKLGAVGSCSDACDGLLVFVFCFVSLRRTERGESSGVCAQFRARPTHKANKQAQQTVCERAPVLKRENERKERRRERGRAREVNGGTVNVLLRVPSSGIRARSSSGSAGSHFPPSPVGRTSSAQHVRRGEG